MSRTSLHRPRRNRAASDRPAIDTRLLPNPFPLGHRMFPLILRFSKGRAETHAWPKTVSLVPPPGDGRSIDSTRQALLQSSHCRDNAPLTGRVYLAGIDLAGESELPAFGRTRAFEPSHDSTVVTIGELPFNDDGLGSMFLFLKVVQRHWWTGMPHTEIFPTFVHILKIVWGCRRVVVDATGVGAGVAAFLRKSPRPSIAYPLPSPTVIPSSLHRHSRLFIPSFLPGQESIPPPSFPTPIGNPSRGAGPLTLSAVEGKGQTGRVPSLVPRQRLRTTVIPRTREESGAGHSVLECASGSTVRPSFLAPRKDFFVEKVFRRQTIKLAANSINYQSIFNQVQSTTNQTLSILNQEQSLFNHNLDPHPYIHPLPPHPLIPIMTPRPPPYCISWEERRYEGHRRRYRLHPPDAT